MELAEPAFWRAQQALFLWPSFFIKIIETEVCLYGREQGLD